VGGAAEPAQGASARWGGQRGAQGGSADGEGADSEGADGEGADGEGADCRGEDDASGAARHEYRDRQRVTNNERWRPGEV